MLLQGPVRDAVKMHGAGVASISEADLRPVILKDFQVSVIMQQFQNSTAISATKHRDGN